MIGDVAGGAPEISAKTHGVDATIVEFSATAVARELVGFVIWAIPCEVMGWPHTTRALSLTIDGDGGVETTVNAAGPDGAGRRRVNRQARKLARSLAADFWARAAAMPQETVLDMVLRW